MPKQTNQTSSGSVPNFSRMISTNWHLKLQRKNLPKLNFFNGKKGFGAISICHRYNKEFGLDGVMHCQLKPTTIQDAVNAMRLGDSPLKKGRPKKIPPQQTIALATHSMMKQIKATEGEASGINMIPLIKAMTNGTIWEGKFSAKYAWRRAHRDHPEHFFPAKSISHDYRRAEWLTAQNINDWTDNHKKYLINIHFVKNEPGSKCE